MFQTYFRCEQNHIKVDVLKKSRECKIADLKDLFMFSVTVVAIAGELVTRDKADSSEGHREFYIPF